MLDETVAVAGLDDGSGWIGFERRAPGRYAVVVGHGADRASAEADSDAAIALAVAYFDGGLPQPPDGLAATHADVADLVRDVASAEKEPERRRLLSEAVDAIDDGLGADMVISTLTASLSPSVGDPVRFVLWMAARIAGDD